MENIEEYIIFRVANIKVIIVGDSGVGKTSLLLRYIYDKFEENFIKTVGLDYMVKKLNIDGTNVAIQIWDTAGQEKFRNLISYYFGGVDGAIIIFDKTDLQSFENVTMWLELVSRSIESQPKILIGNKEDDIEHFQIESYVARQMANELKMSYFETSALNKYQVDIAFETICREALIYKMRNLKSSITLELTKKYRIKECCLLQ